MQARSALFDLYGDHLRSRAEPAPVAAVVKLLAHLDIAAPAVRTAISRMVRQGWLVATPTRRGPGYQLSERATRRLDEAAARIYRLRPDEPWDGHWSIALLSPVRDRAPRERIHRALGYLGYRPMQPESWIAPRPAPELESVVVGEGASVSHFRGRLDGDDRELVTRLWSPDDLARAYLRWLDDARALVAEAGADAGADADEPRAFAVRSRLVHEWRKFLFSDPGLPRELLPTTWPGEDAAAYFDSHAARLAPAASRFVDRCLEGDP